MDSSDSDSENGGAQQQARQQQQQHHHQNQLAQAVTSAPDHVIVNLETPVASTDISRATSPQPDAAAPASPQQAASDGDDASINSNDSDISVYLPGVMAWELDEEDEVDPLMLLELQDFRCEICHFKFELKFYQKHIRQVSYEK